MFQSDVDEAARETLRLIGPDPQNWVPDRHGGDHNVAIIGGGQSGSAFAFALRRAGIGRVTVIDASHDAASSGPWLSSARMHKLRTPKGLPGPELGLPGLSFQAWYEARHGAVAYEAIDRIARVDWAAYLDWYRNTLGIEVRYRTKLVRIEPAQDHLRLHLDIAGEAKTETARKIILASGFPSNGVRPSPTCSPAICQRSFTRIRWRRSISTGSATSRSRCWAVRPPRSMPRQLRSKQGRGRCISLHAAAGWPRSP